MMDDSTKVVFDRDLQAFSIEPFEQAVHRVDREIKPFEVSAMKRWKIHPHQVVLTQGIRSVATLDGKTTPAGDTNETT
jgi:hypothetical protein